MKIPRIRRSAVRAIVLLAASGAAASLVVDNETDTAGTGAKTRVAAPAIPIGSGAARPLPPVDLAKLSRPLRTQIRDHLFDAPPPPPPPPAQAPAPTAPVVVAPPPKPVAPPLPFKFLGRLVDHGTTTVFVSHNGQNLNLKQGDTAADLYRVEQITSAEIVFRYEPLAERQVLATGSPQ